MCGHIEREWGIYWFFCFVLNCHTRFFSLQTKASAVFSCSSCISAFHDCEKCSCSSSHTTGDRWSVGCFRSANGFSHLASLRNFKYWFHSPTHSSWLFSNILSNCKMKVYCHSLTCHGFTLSFYNWLQYRHIRLLNPARATICLSCFMVQSMAAFSFEQSYFTSSFRCATFGLLAFVLWSSLPKKCR